MAGEQPKFDACKHLNIKLNPDGTCTRLYKIPRVEQNPNPPQGETIVTKDVIINSEKKTGLRIYRSTNIPSNDNAVARRPILIHLHNSCWVLYAADSPTNFMCCSRMVNTLNFIVVSVLHRLAPEHRLPAHYDDTLDVIMWLKQQAREKEGGEPWLRDYGDFSRCYMFGNSAGANVVLHSALRAMEHDLTPLKFEGFIFYQPLFGGKSRTDSEIKNYADLLMPVPALDTLWDLALPKGVDRDHRFCNPMVEGPHKAKVGMLERCLVIGWAGDQVVDRQQEFVNMLVTAGVKVEARFEEAGFHGVEVIDPRRNAYFLNNMKAFIR